MLGKQGNYKNKKTWLSLTEEARFLIVLYFIKKLLTLLTLLAHKHFPLNSHRVLPSPNLFLSRRKRTG